MMRRLILLCCIILIHTGFKPKPEIRYVSVTAKDGDGIIKLFKAWHITETCDKDKFFELNKLRPQSSLIKGRTYLLPIRIYTFNHKTIRSTLGITNLETAKTIDNQNAYWLKQALKAKSYKEDAELWVLHSMLNCQTAAVLISDDAETEPENQKEEPGTIFGKNFSPDIIDSSLRGCVFYLISGHGGPDPGTNTTIDGHFICEDEYAYDVTLRLAADLMSHKAVVYMIVRDEDDGIRNDTYLAADQEEKVYPSKTIPLGQIKRLKQRTDEVNQLYQKYKTQYQHQRCVEIHIDSRSKNEQIDVFFYHHKSSAKGKALAKTLLHTFSDKYNHHQKGRGYNGQVSTRSLYTLNHCTPGTCYIELGNIMHERDRQRILNSENRQALANWICEGLIADKKSK